jgi:hypothetical protein
MAQIFHGWKDLNGQIETKSAGANAAAFAVYRGTGWAYEFDNVRLREAFIVYHVPHDYVPGTDMYVHAHWSQIVVDTGGPAGVPGNCKWSFDISHAKSFGIPGGAADAFRAPKTTSVIQQGSTTQYGHMLAEVQFTSHDGSATLFEHSEFEIDGVLMLRVYRDAGDASDTLNQSAFLHFVDIHYQSLIGGTPKRVPPFYR